jgi:hypothetical protein
MEYATEFNPVEDFRGLFRALSSYQGDDVFGDVVSPFIPANWFVESVRRFRELADFARAVPCQRGNESLFERLTELYAFSRVRDLLAFGLQPLPRSPTDRLKAHNYWLSRSEPVFAPITTDGYRSFIEAVGAEPIVEKKFQPFFHEIVSVEPAVQIDAPIEIISHMWPAAVLGDLLLGRGGVTVRAGSNLVVPNVGERSTLYFEYWRRGRVTSDLSMGWGSNSQWGTEFRRDYLTDRRFVYNFDGTVQPGRDVEALTSALLTEQQDIELVTHRCFLTDELDDQFPFRVTYTEHR